jgi:hypothetical protein
MKRPPKNENLNEEVWIDYIEDELDPSMKDDLDTYISHSPELDSEVKDFQMVRSQLEDLGSHYKVPEDEEFYNRLHDKIMARVENTQMQSNVVVQLTRKRTLKYAGAIAASLVMAISAWVVYEQNSVPSNVKVAKSSNFLLENTAKNPDAIPETNINPALESDMLIDAAASKLKRMSDSERENLYKKLAE